MVWFIQNYQSVQSLTHLHMFFIAVYQYLPVKADKNQSVELQVCLKDVKAYKNLAQETRHLTRYLLWHHFGLHY